MPDTVLVVDDDFDLAITLRMTLEAHGFSAETASNGREALETVERHMPTVIILDMLMPIMNGWEFARAFAAKHGHAAPILVLTAAENAYARAAEIDADGVLKKPFTTKQLLASVKKLAEQHTRV